MSSGTIDGVGQGLTLRSPLIDNIGNILQLQTFDLDEPLEDQVLVKFLAAPVNPLDIHVLRGAYPIKPPHSINSELVPGFDGVARVLKVGSAVEALKEGDLVIPRSYGLGTWRTHAVLGARSLIRIRRTANPVFAAVLKTVILPAYFLVEDMAHLNNGDWIIQNAGTSAIAQTVAQFARMKGAKTISVIRDRPKDTSSTELITHLAALADVVVEQTDFDPAKIASEKNIRLALDSVWGESGRQLATSLGNGGMFVNYGIFSGGGPTSGFQITMKDISMKGIEFKGFRTTAQATKRGEQELEELLDWFLDLYDAKALRLPRHQEVLWTTETAHSLVDAVNGVVKMERNGCKPIFIFQ